MSLALAPPPEPAIHSEATWPYPPTHPSAGPLTAPPAPPPHARRCRGCTLNGIMSLDVGYKLVVNPTIDPTIEMGTRHEGGRNVGYPCIVGLLGRTHQEPPCIGSLQGATCSLGCVCSLLYINRSINAWHATLIRFTPFCFHPHMPLFNVEFRPSAQVQVSRCPSLQFGPL